MSFLNRKLRANGLEFNVRDIGAGKPTLPNNCRADGVVLLPTFAAGARPTKRRMATTCTPKLTT